jgi:glycosyltransferase involved in cell wall biosynthesis
MRRYCCIIGVCGLAELLTGGAGTVETISQYCTKFTFPPKALRLKSTDMHVLHVETGQQVHGVAHQVLHLIDGLRAIGVGGSLVCPAGSTIAIAARARGIPVLPIRMRGDWDVTAIFRMYRLARRARPSIIHIHSQVGAKTHWAIAARLAGVPAILSRRSESSDSRLFGRSLKYWPYRLIVAQSENIGSQLIEEGIADERLRFVSRGVDAAACQTGWSRNKYLKEFGLQPDDFVIGVVAPLIATKGHRYLLDALPRIRAAHSGARVLLFGEGPLEDRLRKSVSRLGLDDIVKFAGYRIDLLEFIGHTQLMIHPSVREGLGTSLLEAQAAGVPVIGFRISGMSELIAHEESGLLVPPRDSKALAAAAVRLIYNPKRLRTLSANASRWVAEEHSLQRMVQGHLNVYQELVEMNPVYAV